jgi:hypothetical protein
MANYTAFSFLFLSFLYFSVTASPINNIVQTDCRNTAKSCDCIKNEGILYTLKNKLISNYIEFQTAKTEILSEVTQLKVEIGARSINQNISSELWSNIQLLNNQTTLYLINLQNLNVTSISGIQSIYALFLYENTTFSTIFQSIYQQAFLLNTPSPQLPIFYNQLQTMNNTIYNIVQQFDELVLLNQNILSKCTQCCLDNSLKIQNITYQKNLLKASINTIIEYDNIAFDILASKINQLKQYLCNTLSLCVTGTASNLGVYSQGSLTNIGVSTVNGDVAYDFSIAGTPLNVVSGVVYNPLPAQMGIDINNFVNCGFLKGCNVNFGAGITNPGTVTIRPGVYCNTLQLNELFTISSNIVLDGLNMDNPEWLFIIEGTLVIDPSVQITLINTENPCNVAWLIGFNSMSPVSGNSVVMGTNSKIEGSIIANYDVRLNFGSTVTGKSISYANTYLDNSFVNPKNCLGNTQVCSSNVSPLNIPNTYIIS